MVDFSKYIGVPFIDNGRHLDKGCDCWGLARVIWRNEFGFTIPSEIGTYSDEDFASMDEMGRRNISDWVEVPDGDEVCGTGVLMRLHGMPIHVGIVTEKGWMIHTHRGINSVIEGYNTPRWANRIIGFYRYAKI